MHPKLRPWQKEWGRCQCHEGRKLSLLLGAWECSRRMGALGGHLAADADEWLCQASLTWAAKAKAAGQEEWQ